MNDTERAIRLLSRLIPFDSPGRLQSYFSPRIESAELLVAPKEFAKFFLSISALALVGSAAATVLAPGPFLPFTLAPLLILVASPIILLGYRAQRRRRSIDGELPFFAMLLYILSYQSFAGIIEAFEKAEQLGTDVLPSICRESGYLRRNIAYSAAPKHAAVERTFMFHPSLYLRELVHGYQTTLSSGRDVHEFARDQAERLLALHEDRWRAFAAGLSSIAEVSFIFLAVFPVGIQMVAGGFAGGASSRLLSISTVILAPVAGALIMWMDASQPLTRDTPLSGAYLAAFVSASCAVLTVFYLGAIGSTLAAAVLLAISVSYLAKSRAFFERLREGEENVASMLHDLAELTRSGVELPRALARLLDQPGSMGALGEPLSTFAVLMSLGKTPIAAQTRAAHPSWLVRVSFALLAVAFETGGGYEQLERLSSSFRRVSDSRRSVRASVIPFAALGVAVPALSAASFWFLRNMLSTSLGFRTLALATGGTGAGVSILACSVLTGLLLSKAYSQSVRNALGLPPLLASTLVSLLVFGSP